MWEVYDMAHAPTRFLLACIQVLMDLLRAYVFGTQDPSLLCNNGVQHDING